MERWKLHRYFFNQVTLKTTKPPQCEEHHDVSPPAEKQSNGEGAAVMESSSQNYFNTEKTPNYEMITVQ